MICPKCEMENAAGNRFCMTCGADMRAMTSMKAGIGGEAENRYGYSVNSEANSMGVLGMRDDYSGGHNAAPIDYSAPPRFAPPPSSYGSGPTTSSIDQAQLVGFGPRLVAYIIDYVFVTIVGGVAQALAANAGVIGSLIALVITLALLAYYPYFWVARNGQTLGNMAMNIRVVRTDGSNLTVGRAILRYLGYFVDTIPVLLGWLWCIWDTKKQCFHDKIADTVVIRA